MLIKKITRPGTYTNIKFSVVRKNRVLVSFLVFGGFVVCVIWFILFSKFWDIKHLEINDLTSLSRGEVASTTFEMLDDNDHFLVKGRNILFLDLKNLEKALNDKLFVESVAVDKSYPDVLRLLIKERQRSVVIASKDQFLTVDINGVVTGEAASSTIDELRSRLTSKTLSDNLHPPLIWLDLQELATSGYQIAKPETIKTWLDAYQALSDSDIKFRYVKIDDAKSRTFKTRLEDGIDLLLDIQVPLEPQFETYVKYVQSKPSNKPLEYIDVRIPGKLYIK